MGAMAQDPVLLIGVVILAGALGATAARAAKAPAACGAMMGGFALRVLLGPASAPADPSSTLPFLLAFTAFLLGAEIDLGALRRLGPPAFLGLGLGSALVAPLAFLGSLAAGAGPGVALPVALAAVAGSPAAAISVAVEARARGSLTQRILVSSCAGLALGVALCGPALSGPGRLAGLGGSILLGVVAGGWLLVPLSRMTTRAGILAASGGGLVTILAASTWVGSHAAHLMLMAAVAGLMAGNLLPNRELVRSALRDFGMPAGVALYAALGFSVAPEALGRTYLPAAVAVLAARAAGLALAGLMLRRDGDRFADLALLPTAGGLAAAPALAGLDASGHPALQAIAGILLAAGFLSEAVGTIATRWSLVRSGEAAGTSEDPDAWRARMA